MRGRSVRWILARPPGCGRLRFIPLLLLVCPLLLLLCASAWAETGPTVHTDQSDYAFHSTVLIGGSGFADRRRDILEPSGGVPDNWQKAV